MSADATKRGSSRSSQVPGPPGFRSLLVAIDLTASSDRVLGRLSLLPIADDARVTVLHVVPRTLTHNEQRKAERDAIRAVADEVRHYRRSLPRGVHVQPLVTVGAPAKAISSCAATMKAELVVMGRGSGRILRDEFIGSTAERVIRRGRVPVLVVRLAPRSRYARPALAIALDEAAYEAVAVLLRMLPAPHPSVAVIHAFDAPYHSHVYSSIREDEEQERMAELQLTAAKQVASLLRKALRRASVELEDAPAFEPDIRLGSARIVVDKAVRKSGNDLLALGTHGYSVAPYLILGTVAGDLLRRSKCDVLIVPPVRSRD